MISARARLILERTAAARARSEQYAREDRAAREKRAVEATADWPTLDRVAEAHISATLERVAGNISAAARLLGLCRSALQRRMRAMGIR